MTSELPPVSAGCVNCLQTGARGCTGLPPRERKGCSAQMLRAVGMVQGVLHLHFIGRAYKIPNAAVWVGSQPVKRAALLMPGIDVV